MKRSLILIIIAAFAAPTTGKIAPELLIGEGDAAQFPWTVTDGGGAAWDIGTDGTIGDGSNNAYDGGMRLHVNGAAFAASTEKAKVDPSGREIQLGPFQAGSITVYRRIYVSETDPVCRFVDLFHNNADSDAVVALRYYSNMGERTKSTITTSGQTTLTSGDWGVVTGNESSGRPAVGHIFASRGGRVKPSFSCSPGSDKLYYRLPLKVPAGQTVGLCLFEFQAESWDGAAEKLKQFRVGRGLAGLSPTVKAVLCNVSGDVSEAGDVVIRRSRKADSVTLRDGSQLTGELLGETYTINTVLGPLTVPAGRTAGIKTTGERGVVQLLSTDGQVLVGKLTSGPIRLRLADGNTRELTIGQFSELACRLEKNVAAGDAPVLVFRTGDRLTFTPDRAAWPFLTRHGAMTITGEQIREIDLDTKGGVHAAVLRDGGRLSGLLTDRRIRGALDLGGRVELDRNQLRQIVYPGEKIPVAGARKLTLRNGNVLYGALAEKTIALNSPQGPRTIATETIQEVQFFGGDAVVRTKKNEELKGRMATDTLTCRTLAGAAVTVHTTLLTTIETATDAKAKAPAETAAKKPTAKATPNVKTPTSQPAAMPGLHTSVEVRAVTR